jgi:hypothetical protein
MKPVLQVIKQHPWASIFYFLYGLIYLAQLSQLHRYRIERKLMGEGNRIAFSEGVTYGALITVFIGVVFILILLLNAAFRKGQYKFYLLLCLPILAAITFIILNYLQ